jgi:hypothetical protein
MAWWSGPLGDEHWDNQQQHIFDVVTSGNREAQDDTKLAALFDAAIFHFGPEADKAQDALSRYLWEEYDIDFEAEMPWEEWRAWYEGTK